MTRRFPETPIFYRDLDRTYRTAVRGQGVYLYDEAGKRYLDACGGALVVNVGHGREELARAMADQATALGYVHGSQFTTDAIEAWAEALVPNLPRGMGKLYLVPGGTEATETAIKLAREYQLATGHPSRHRTLACRPSYHGNTLGALSASGRPPLRQPYLPMLANEAHAPAPYCYRCPLQETYPACELACADVVSDVIEELGAGTVAAFLVEPVLGAAAGVAVPPPEYLPRVRAICDRLGVLLIVDEILTGFGRTGDFLASEASAVTPDILLLGKGLTGGALPGGAVAVRDDIAVAIHERRGRFTHGFTFSHHPVVAAVSLEVLRILEREALVARVRRLEKAFFSKLESLRAFPVVGDIRGKGLLAGIELVTDRETKTPFPRRERLVERVAARAFESGLVVYTSAGIADGRDGDAVLLAPPFVIDEGQIDELVRLLRKTLAESTHEVGGM